MRSISLDDKLTSSILVFVNETMNSPGASELGARRRPRGPIVGFRARWRRLRGLVYPYAVLPEDQDDKIAIAARATSSMAQWICTGYLACQEKSSGAMQSRTSKPATRFCMQSSEARYRWLVGLFFSFSLCENVQSKD